MMNPFQMMGAMQNPMALLQEQVMGKFKSQNPQMFNQIQQMVNGKNESQLKEMAFNIAKEKNIDLNKFAGQFGIKL